MTPYSPKPGNPTPPTRRNASTDQTDREASAQATPSSSTSETDSSYRSPTTGSIVSSTLLGYLFNLSQSNILKNIRIHEPLVKEALPLPSKIHQRARRLETLDEIEKQFPGIRAFLDATEQEIPRPRDKAKRRTHYSEKKKRHTVQDTDHREQGWVDPS